jgi:uncharacterized membrane protein YhaH (DUF805 family)
MDALFEMFQVSVVLVAGMLAIMGVPVFLMVLCSLLIFQIIPALLCIPLLRKAGFSAWWALPALIPGMIIPMLWIFAFIRWPRYPSDPR